MKDIGWGVCVSAKNHSGAYPKKNSLNDFRFSVRSRQNTYKTKTNDGVYIQQIVILPMTSKPKPKTQQISFKAHCNRRLSKLPKSN